jgi:hypothetical protein
MRSPCSLCVCVPPPPSLAKQWLGKRVQVATNIHLTTEELFVCVCVLFMHSVSYQIFSI